MSGRPISVIEAALREALERLAGDSFWVDDPDESHAYNLAAEIAARQEFAADALAAAAGIPPLPPVVKQPAVEFGSSPFGMPRSGAPAEVLLR